MAKVHKGKHDAAIEKRIKKDAQFLILPAANRKFFAQIVAANGKEVWRTSEVYNRRREARNAIDIVIDSVLTGRYKVVNKTEVE